MKYNPKYSPFRNFNYTSKKQLGKHLGLVKLNPDNQKTPYYCTLCEKTFLTSLGASCHVDFIHTEEVLKILQESQ